MKTPRHMERGFALISSLAILSILVILIVAYSVTMRTERTASQNFQERERAQAIGQAVLSHLMADHAAPKVGNSRLKPFAVDPATKLPTKETEDVYYADKPEPGIYTINPMPGLSTRNHLVRVSRKGSEFSDGSSTSESFDYTENPAYTPADWAWARQTQSSVAMPGTDSNLFLPQTKEGTPIAPQWVDYYELDPKAGNSNPSTNPEDSIPVPVGQVAFAIWDESGKVDINLAGKDSSVNGIAPHDLKFEEFVLPAKRSEFMAHLNGGTETDPRDRNNFSLRRISENTAENNKGNDRWFFSVEEMLERGFFSSNSVLDVTHSSRDFDVRPEWDGDRSPATSQKFLRSYINNPRLFDLFTHPRASSRLVVADQREQVLRQRLAMNGFPATEDWMQVMRLISSLRLSLPPFRNMPSPAVEVPLPMNQWTDDDVWGIALNIMQASAPASDQNLFAFDRNSFGVQPFNDPNVRIGIRVSPYITEVALRATRLNATQVRLEQFIEIWNPYAVDLFKPGTKTPIRYFYGTWTGDQWETTRTNPTGGIYNMGQRWEMGTPASPNPAPGGFVVKRLERIVTWPTSETRDLQVRTRPYLQNADFWGTLRTGTGGGVEESSSYSISIATFYSKGGGDAKYNMIHVIPSALINRPVSAGSNQYIPAWHSFQIDDPRMGPYSRYNANWANRMAPMHPNWSYTWQAIPDAITGTRHSLFGIPKDPLIPGNEKFISQYGDGYNENFGANWPKDWPADQAFAKAMATFALPQRPFLNVGELGSVFANRPWRTLNFAMTAVPYDTSVPAGSKPQNYPTALLDYLTTVGTTTESRNLPYRMPAAIPPVQAYPLGFIKTNLDTRAQKPIWLFESVDKTNNPTGNLRPIRGRINLNSASRSTIRQLLLAPYRMVRSFGINGTPVDPLDPASDVFVKIAPAEADMIADEIVGTPDTGSGSIRPIRSMADLGKLKSIPKLHAKYPDPLVDAVIGRLAQFGTVRQQIYTVDIIARALNPEVERKRRKNPSLPRVVTGEVRFMARVYFDTFSRRGFVESIEYR